MLGLTERGERGRGHDFETGEELAYFDVGDHPQRIRHGYVRNALLDSLDTVGSLVTSADNAPTDRRGA